MVIDFRSQTGFIPTLVTLLSQPTPKICHIHKPSFPYEQNKFLILMPFSSSKQWELHYRRNKGSFQCLQENVQSLVSKMMNLFVNVNKKPMPQDFDKLELLLNNALISPIILTGLPSNIDESVLSQSFFNSRVLTMAASCISNEKYII